MSAELIMASIYSLWMVPGGGIYSRHSQGHRENTTFKLRRRPCRESHHGIVLDPDQGELADAPVQREASQLRLGRVRRKDFNLPAAQVLDQPAQLQPDFHVLCRGLVIIVEQVENQSPTVGFPTQLAQHVTARLQAEARPSSCGLGARRNSRLRLSGPDDDTPAGGER